MPEPSYEIEPMDRVVNIYRSLRADGETVELAWRWACLIARAVETESFREDVENDLAALAVTA